MRNKITEIKLGRHDYARIMQNSEISYPNSLPSIPYYRNIPVVCNNNLADYEFTITIESYNHFQILNLLNSFIL